MTRPMIALGLALLVLASAGAAAPARRPSGKDLAAAKACFQQGRAYYEAGAWADAIREYERAYALAPLPELLFNIAQAYRMQGDKPRAIAAYERYLSVVTEGAIAEEARAHIAALRLKIQVEEAEAARRKAVEEAEAAKRRAGELEAAQRRAEAEAKARLRAQREDAERLRMIATEEAERTRMRREADHREYERKKMEAMRRGKPLRYAGRTLIALGASVAALSLGALVMAFNQDDKLKEWDRTTDRWSEDWENDVKNRKLFNSLFLGQSIGGGSLLILGVVLYRVGVTQRRRASEAVTPPITLQPLFGPGRAGLSVGGRF